MTTEEKINNAVNKVLQTANRKLLDLDYEFEVKLAALSVITKIKLIRNYNQLNRHK